MRDRLKTRLMKTVFHVAWLAAFIVGGNLVLDLLGNAAVPDTPVTLAGREILGYGDFVTDSDTVTVLVVWATPTCSACKQLFTMLDELTVPPHLTYVVLFVEGGRSTLEKTADKYGLDPDRVVYGIQNPGISFFPTVSLWMVDPDTGVWGMYDGWVGVEPTPQFLELLAVFKE